MKREEREQLLKDTLLYFAPKDRYVTDEEGNMYYREDVTLKAMELSEQPLPPAEGAEEILNKLLGNPGDSINVNSYQIKPLMVDGKAEWWIVHHGVGSGEPLTQWLNEFATLHAQKLADKMGEEMLRDEKAFTDWYINHVEIESREEKYNIDNETTIYSFSDLMDYWNRYLKQRQP